VNLKETLSQVNNSEDTGMVAYLFFTCYTFTRKPSGKTPFWSDILLGGWRRLWR